MIKGFLNILTGIIVIVNVISCKKHDIDVNKKQSFFVVDGWIEEGKIAKVIISRNTSYFKLVDSSAYFNLVIMAAKVTIQTNDQEEILILKKDTSLFPQQVYETRIIKGVAGESYHLKIDYHDTILTATTTIPQKPKIDSLWFEFLSDDDSVALLQMKFIDKVNEKNYYRIFSKTQDEKKYYPAIGSTVDDYFLEDSNVITPIMKGKVAESEGVNDFYYKIGDIVSVKLCNIDKASYDFWFQYQFEILNAFNPFASSGINLNSNIEGEGLGIWSGCNCDRYIIKIWR